jgi:hypothetical protein
VQAADASAEYGKDFRDREFTLAVNFHEERAVRLGIKLYPDAAKRQNLRPKKRLTAQEF